MAFQVHLHLILGFTLMGAGRQASTMKPIGRRFQVEKSVIPPFHSFNLYLAEMIPELIVPDLYDCKLKPYVSYKTKEINQEELTSRYLSVGSGRYLQSSFM